MTLVFDESHGEGTPSSRPYFDSRTPTVTPTNANSESEKENTVLSAKRTPLGSITSILKNHNESQTGGDKPFSVRAQIEQLESNKRKKDNQRRLSFRTPPPTNSNRRKSVSSTASSRVASSLKKEVLELRSHVQKLDGENMDKDELLLLIQGKDEEIDLQAEELSSLNQKLSKIQGGLRDIDSERQALTVKVGNLEKEKQDLTEQLSRREKEVTLLACRLESQSSKMKDINVIQDKYGSMQKEIDRMRQTAKDYETNMELLQQLQVDMEISRNECESLAEKLRDVESERREALEKFDQSSKHLEELREEKRQWKELKQRIEDGANESIQTEKLRHQAEMKEIRSQLDLKSDQLHLLKRRITEDANLKECEVPEDTKMSSSDLQAVESKYLEEIAELRRDLKNKDNSVESLVREIEELNCEIAEMEAAFQNQLASLKADHHKSTCDLHEQHQNQVAILTDEKQAYEKLAKEMEEDIHRLKIVHKDEIVSVHKDRKSMTSRFHSSLNQIEEDAINGIAKLRTVLEEKHARVLFLENQVQEMDSILDELQACHDQEMKTLTEDHLGQLQSHREQATKTLSNLRSELKGKDTIIKSLDEKIAFYQSSQASRDNEHSQVVEEYKSTIENLKREVQVKIEEEANDSNYALSERIIELELKLHEVDLKNLEDKASMKAEFEAKYRALQDEHESKLLILQRTLEENMSGECESHTEEMEFSLPSDNLSNQEQVVEGSEAKPTGARFQNLKEILSNIKEKHTLAIKGVNECHKNEMKELRREHEDLLREIGEKDTAIEQLQNDVSQMRRALQLSPASQLRSEVSSLKEKVSKQEREILDARGVITRLENERTELEKQFSDIKMSLAEEFSLKESTLNELEKKTNERHTKNAEEMLLLKDAVEALTKENRSLKSQQEQEIWSKEQDLLEKDSVIAILQQEASDRTQQMMQVEESRKEESTRRSLEVEELVHKLENERSSYESLTREKDELVQRLHEMEAKGNAKDRLLEQSAQEAQQKACQEKNQFDQSITDLEQKYSEQEFDIMSLRHELANRLEDLMTESAKAALVEETATNMEQLEFQLKALKDTHHAQREDLFYKSIEVAHLEAELLKRDIEMEFANGRDVPEGAALHATLESQKQLIQKLEESLRKSSSELNDECLTSRSEYEWRKNLQFKCADLESMLDDKRHQVNGSSEAQDKREDLPHYRQKDEVMKNLTDKFMTAKSSLNTIETTLTELHDIQKAEDALWDKEDENQQERH